MQTSVKIIVKGEVQREGYRDAVGKKIEKFKYCFCFSRMVRIR